MFEHRSQPLLTRQAFLRRMAQHGGYAVGLVIVSLIIGTAGFALFAAQTFLDALLNASMLLAGMGLVGEIHSAGGKLFASAFALYAALVFIAVSAIVTAPLLHRWLHKFHISK
jgi:hypothetical protein